MESAPAHAASSSTPSSTIVAGTLRTRNVGRALFAAPTTLPGDAF
jgi:hypothetical protein